MAFLLLFLISLLIAACPVIAILFLMRMKIIRESFALTLTATLLTTALGLGTTVLSIVFCASAMADGGPTCVTGAVMFLPIGLLSTAITFSIGLVSTIESFRQRLSDAPLHR